MRYLVIAVLALVVGGFVARAYYKKDEPEPVDPITVIVMQMKTHSIIEHERQVAVWYRACPKVVGVDPEIFVAWPAKLSYELELSDISIERDGETLKVRTRAIHPDEPAVPTDFLDYLSKSSLFTFSNDELLVNLEIRKASALARYLTAYYLLWDGSLTGEFAGEIEGLVGHLAGALGVPAAKIEVEIEKQEVKLPKLPAIELCGSSTASVNGLPFAKMSDQYTVPIKFRLPPSKSASAAQGSQQVPRPEGIASVYGAVKSSK